MPWIERELVPGLSSSTGLVGWILVAYLITFLATRAITRAIRSDRGRFHDASAGGVHLHHAVYGIFLLLSVGTAEFTYRPGAPWVQILAALFGVGAALTLDEFALWLRLEDVYWMQEGRSSVDAVLIAFVVGGLLLTGANPFNAEAGQGELVAALTITANLGFAMVAILKGRPVLGVIGVLVPLVALGAALRLARPSSPWARRWYPAGSRQMARSRKRFPPGRRSWWDPLVDLFAPATLPPHDAPAGAVLRPEQDRN
jgi:hypothetical protein